MKKFRDNSYAEINRYKKEIGTLKNVLRSYVVLSCLFADFQVSDSVP